MNPRLGESGDTVNKKKWAISIAASVLLVVAVVVAVFGTGYRFFVVETPSMATTAPVGTLVVVHPKASYAVGDIVSYQAKNSSKIYTHRIVDQTAQGWITKGDLNGAADPLPVTDQQIVGKVGVIVKYLGFFVRGLPYVLLGWALVFALTLLPRVRPSWRWQIRLIGWSLVVSVVALWLRPWVNLVMTGYVPAEVGVDMHLVNTGIFPVDVLGTVLQSGQDAVVNQQVIDPDGKYRVTPTLALTFGWFVLMGLICAIPMVAALFVRVQDEVDPSDEGDSTDEGDPSDTDVDADAHGETLGKAPKISARRTRRAFLLTNSAVAVVLALSVAFQASSQAALSAAVTNSVGTAGTRTWFSCKNAETGTATARFAWSLSATGNQTDLTGNGRTGTVFGTAPTVNTSSPCPNDGGGSLNFTGATCITQRSAVTGNSTYSLEVWFKTTTAQNGKLIGFGDNQQVGDSKWDRHIYIDASGRVLFGTYPYDQRVVSSPAGTNYANGAWHHVMATSSAAGVMALYLDGNLVASRSDAAGQEVYTGYWKVGCGNLSSWQDANGTWQYNWPNYYTGQLRYAAVYSTTLTATQAMEHYIAGTA